MASLARGGAASDVSALAVAYLWRPIWILLRLPKAIIAVRRARRGEAQPKG